MQLKLHPERIGTAVADKWECRYEFDFPRDEVFVFLKQRKRTLSLHSMHDFIGMKKHENFSYEVLLGDKDKIAEALSKQEA